jgi:hypothetical protein
MRSLFDWKLLVSGSVCGRHDVDCAPGDHQCDRLAVIADCCVWMAVHVYHSNHCICLRITACIVSRQILSGQWHTHESRCLLHLVAPAYYAFAVSCYEILRAESCSHSAQFPEDVQSNAVCLSFGPIGESVCMRSKAWLAARVWLRLARLPPPASRVRRSRRLRDTLAAASGLLAHASVTELEKLCPVGPKLRYTAVA